MSPESPKSQPEQSAAFRGKRLTMGPFAMPIRWAALLACLWLLMQSPMYMAYRMSALWGYELWPLRSLAQLIMVYHHDTGTFPGDDPSGVRWHDQLRAEPGWDPWFSSLEITPWDPAKPAQEFGRFASFEDGTVVHLGRYQHPSDHAGIVHYFPPGDDGSPARLVWTGRNRIDEQGSGDDVTILLIPGQPVSLSYGPWLYDRELPSVRLVPAFFILLACITIIALLVRTNQPRWRTICWSLSAVCLSAILIGWYFTWYPARRINLLISLPALLLPCFLLAELALTANVRFKLRYPGHLCTKCGYDMRGITAQRCPECGLPQAIALADEPKHD